MNTIDVLRGARELLAKPEAWTKGYYAYDRDGFVVAIHAPEACSFCLLGAIRRAAGEGDDRPAANMVAGDVAKFNDAPTTTHADVLALLDKAIAQLDAATVKDSLTVREETL